MADDIEEINLDDPALDEYERMIAEMSDEDNPGGSKKKAAAPKPAPAQKKPALAPAQAPKKKPAHHDDSDDPLDDSYLDLERQLHALEEESGEKPKKQSAPAHHEEPVEDEGGNKDQNGVTEEKLIEEEDKYHTKESIMSLEALTHEISNYINPILDGHLVGEDYREIISANKDEWEMYIEKTTKLIQNQKLTLEKYLEIIRIGLSNETDLLKTAKAKKASVTTVQRIAARVDIIRGEIKQYTDPEGAEAAPEPEEPKPAASRKETAAPEKPKVEKKKHLVQVEKLEELSKVLNQYIFLIQYWAENKMEVDQDIIVKVREVKKLFTDPYTITPGAFGQAMKELPPVTLQMLLGTTPAERQAKIDVILKEAEESFEKMKDFGCTKEEAKDTAETIKYLKKIREAHNVPLPKTKVNNLEKVAANKVNNTIPDNTIRCFLKKLDGAGGHRVFFLKYSFDLGSGPISAETPYHDASRNFNVKIDFTAKDTLKKDVLNGSIKVEFYKRKFQLFSKYVGAVYIPLKGLQGTIQSVGVAKLDYKGEDMNLHYVLELKRMLDRKIVIKQFVLEKLYKAFNINLSEEMRSHLLPKEPPAEEPPKKPAQTVSELPQRTDPVNVRPPPKSNIDMSSKESEMEEPPQQSVSGSGHPLGKDLQILSKKEQAVYLGQLKEVKASIPQEVDIKDLIDYEKNTFSIQYMTVFLQELARQAAEIEGMDQIDMDAAKKCSDLDIELTKKKGQIERGMAAGKLTPEDYMNTLNAEYTRVVGVAKFIKKSIKSPKVTKFVFARLKILDAEIKELEEFMKSGGGQE